VPTIVQWSRIKDEHLESLKDILELDAGIPPWCMPDSYLTDSVVLSLYFGIQVNFTQFLAKLTFIPKF